MKTTKRNFDIFKEECLYWIGYFNLLNWEKCFILKRIGDASAKIYWDNQSKQAKLILNSDFSKEEFS